MYIHVHIYTYTSIYIYMYVCIKCEMYSRDLSKKKAMKSNSPGDWLHFKEKRNAVNQLVKRTKKLYYQDEIKNSAGNPKETWKVLNNLMGKKTNGTELNKININECDLITKPRTLQMP